VSYRDDECRSEARKYFCYPFADLRQVMNRIAEAHHRSILADDVQPDRRFLLSSYESTSHVRPIARSALRALTCKGPGRRQQRTSVACSASGRCSFRRSPISHSLSARGSVLAAVIRCSSARPGTTNTNDATKTSCKDSKRLLAPSRVNYEWAMRAFCDLPDKEGRRTGTKLIKSVTPRAADKIYDKLVEGPSVSRSA
jgi:hypothetical protein